MSTTVLAFQKRLEEISMHGGVPFGRANLIFDDEDAYSQAAITYRGFLTLSDAFKCFVLETVEMFNSVIAPRVSEPLSDQFPQFMPRTTQGFKTLCAAERIALRGYPYHGYTLLRNEFDNLVLTSAALQGLTDFYEISGIDPSATFDPVKSKKMRKEVEFRVRKQMTGSKSGLGQQVIDELGKLDELYDYETHGSRLSLTHAADWMRGRGGLPIVPKFEERAFAMFMNRFCEVAWMLHRVIPLIQPPGVSMTDTWKSKWRIIDESFSTTIHSLTKDNKLFVGEAFVKFIESKFPFTDDSTFPL